MTVPGRSAITKEPVKYAAQLAGLVNVVLGLWYVACYIGRSLAYSLLLTEMPQYVTNFPLALTAMLLLNPKAVHHVRESSYTLNPCRTCLSAVVENVGLREEMLCVAVRCPNVQLIRFVSRISVLVCQPSQTPHAQ